ncbi:hypothetical protein, partial [Streptomyces sp. M2CJ-2]|uniref:hypothetical protein n=1 Tax=Streptomyces sp. M2CJ-2 TaxID=2803948 RepID=UPI001F420B4F
AVHGQPLPHDQPEDHPTRSANVTAPCQGLADEEFPPRGNRAFQDALIDGLEMADDPRARQ